MTVVQHRPGFIDLDVPPEGAHVETVADLLALPWVQRWHEVGEVQWRRSPYVDCSLLLAVLPDSFWVVAYVQPASALEALPEWTQPEHLDR